MNDISEPTKPETLKDHFNKFMGPVIAKLKPEDRMKLGRIFFAGALAFAKITSECEKNTPNKLHDVRTALMLEIIMGAFV